MATDLTTFLGGGGGIKSVQRGTSGMSNLETSVTVNITAVNLSKSFLVFSNTTSDDDNLRSFVQGRLNATNSIFFNRRSSQNDLSIAWEVVEFE